jgi:hypothetical protein
VSTSNGRAKPISLDRILSEFVGEFDFANSTHGVRGLNAEQYAWMLSTGGEFDLLEGWKIVESIVPSLTHEQVQSLTAPAVAAILKIADGRINEVNAQFPPAPDDPNAVGPTPGETPPASA